MRGKSFRGFAADIDKFAEHVRLSPALVRKKIAFDLFGNIVERSPVDSGRLRMSWAMADGVQSDATGPEGGTGGDGGSAEAVARSNITATFIDPFEVTWITNPLPYAERIEFGYSQKAPSGMVRISLAEVELELRGEI